MCVCVCVLQEVIFHDVQDLNMVENETPERQPRRREVGITATYCIYDDALIDGTNDSSGRKTGALVQYDGNNPPSTPPSSSTSRSPSVYYFRSDGTTTATITTATATANGEHDELVEETKNEIIRFGLPEGVDVHNPGKVRENKIFFFVWVALFHLDRSIFPNCRRS